MKIVSNFAAEIKVTIGDKTHAQIREEILEAGGNIGKTSLQSLLSGERVLVCGYEVMDIEEDAPVNEVIAIPVILPVVEPVALVAQSTAAVNDTPASAGLVAEIVDVKTVQHPATASWFAVCDTADNKIVIKSIRRGTKRSKVFELLANPVTGMSVAELVAATGESEGSVKVIISQKTKKKGYSVLKEEINGRGTVHFLAIGGLKIGTEAIIYAEKGEEVAE